MASFQQVIPIRLQSREHVPHGVFHVNLQSRRMVGLAPSEVLGELVLVHHPADEVLRGLHILRILCNRQLVSSQPVPAGSMASSQSALKNFRASRACLLPMTTRPFSSRSAAP